MPPIRLIVNADDLGNGAATDRGIFAAFSDGIVRSASLLATGPTWRQAAGQALAVGLPVGVHLDLSEGIAAGGPVVGITDAQGRFAGKVATRQKLASGRIEAATLAGEFLAQIERVRAAGLVPDHLDTHQHCALFPTVTDALIRAARASGILRVRLPLPAETANVPDPPALVDELALYRRLAPGCAAALQSAGLSSPQGLFGMPLLGRLDEPQLLALLETLPAGDWELMVHPGFRDAAHPFATAAREAELAALTAPAVRALIARRGIALISFGELPCAC